MLRLFVTISVCGLFYKFLYQPFSHVYSRVILIKTDSLQNAVFSSLFPSSHFGCLRHERMIFRCNCSSRTLHRPARACMHLLFIRFATMWLSRGCRAFQVESEVTRPRRARSMSHCSCRSSTSLTRPSARSTADSRLIKKLS